MGRNALPPCGEEPRPEGGRSEDGRWATRLRPSPSPHPLRRGGAQMAPPPSRGRRRRPEGVAPERRRVRRHGCVEPPPPTPSRGGGGQDGPPPFAGRRPKAGGGSLRNQPAEQSVTRGLCPIPLPNPSAGGRGARMGGVSGSRAQFGEDARARRRLIYNCWSSRSCCWSRPRPAWPCSSCSNRDARTSAGRACALPLGPALSARSTRCKPRRRTDGPAARGRVLAGYRAKFRVPCSLDSLAGVVTNRRG